VPVSATTGKTDLNATAMSVWGPALFFGAAIGAMTCSIPLSFFKRTDIIELESSGQHAEPNAWRPVYVPFGYQIIFCVSWIWLSLAGLCIHAINLSERADGTIPGENSVNGSRSGSPLGIDSANKIAGSSVSKSSSNGADDSVLGNDVGGTGLDVGNDANVVILRDDARRRNVR
jgi:hypothetical protein